MKISLNWVRQFTDVDLPTEELVRLATERLGGVEGYDELSKHYEGITVARVVSCQKHPNADKLSLCKIDDGGVVKNVARDEAGNVQVVCGAPNVKEGLLVAWIPPASIVPASYGEKELFVLEARDLRGELSNGMLASARELGLNDDHDGILEIDSKDLSSSGSTRGSDTELDSPIKSENDIIGMSFAKLYDLNDTIIEIENKMFTHRPDGFGQLGVAREIAGIQQQTFVSPDWYLNRHSSIKSRTSSELVSGSTNDEEQIPKQVRNDRLIVKNEIPELCPRYTAVIIDDITIKPSPIWLQSYLKRVGVRPINNVVDITNYIMLLTAQPLHAFDFDKVAKDGKAEITVRKPKQGETLTLLDGKTVEPHPEAALICNPDGPIALGGVMGGANSEVDQHTKRVVLECATFDMYNIRRTSMHHGIFTDAVTRFTKGQPAEQLLPVLHQTMKMFQELAGASVKNGVVDSAPLSERNKPQISITASFINQRLGSSFTEEEIQVLLENVEFKVHNNNGLHVIAPFWRTDIEIPEDVVEEVGRLYGFNQLPIELPKRSISPVATDPLMELKTEVREALAKAGANEVSTYSFVHSNTLQKAGQDPDRAFALRNALSPDLQYYRLSLLPSLLEKLRPNVKAGFDEFVLFEIGKSHSKNFIDETTNVPTEHNYLEMVYTSAKPQQGAAYYHIQKLADSLLLELGVQYKLLAPDQEVIENSEKKIQMEQPFNMQRSAYMHYKFAETGGMIGLIGELEDSVIQAFKLPKYTAAALFALDGQSFDTAYRNPGGVYLPLSKYEISKQDLTLQVAETVTFSEIKSLLEVELAKTEYHANLDTLGIYQKEGTDTRNITFRITLSHPERTLTTAEVTKLVEKLSWQAHKVLGAKQV